MKVDGKVALITGGARGLGKAFAEALLENGAKVCLLDVSSQLGIETSNEFNRSFGLGSSAFIKCDVTSQEQMEHAFAWTKATFGSIDIVINNAGIFDHSEEKWEKTVAINLAGVIRGSFLATKYMKAKNGGTGGLILNVASVAGLMTMGYGMVYGASKFGCVGFTRNLAALASSSPDLRGIRVSCLCPSFTDTDMFSKELLDELDPDDPAHKIFDAAMKTFPLMKVDEVVRSFMALVDDDREQGGILQVTPQGAVYVYPRQLKGSKL